MQFIFACLRTYIWDLYFYKKKEQATQENWFLFKIRLGCWALLTKELLTAAKSKKKLLLLAQNFVTKLRSSCETRQNRQIAIQTHSSNLYLFWILCFLLDILRTSQSKHGSKLTKEGLKDIPSLRQSKHSPYLWIYFIDK